MNEEEVPDGEDASRDGGGGGGGFYDPLDFEEEEEPEGEGEAEAVDDLDSAPPNGRDDPNEELGVGEDSNSNAAPEEEIFDEQGRSVHQLKDLSWSVFTGKKALSYIIGWIIFY